MTAFHHLPPGLKIFSFFLACFSILAGAPAQAATPAFIIDTDVGIDDVIAITYLLKQPDLQIKAITLETNGVTHQAPAVKNIRSLLSFLGRAELPIACGPNQPLGGKAQHFSPLILRLNDSLADTALPVAQAPASLPCASAPVLLTRVLAESQQPLQVLALGPLTNLALVLRRHPDLAKKIETIYIMGGALRVPGNIDDVFPSSNKKAEWNIYLDPVAAQTVFHAGIKIVLVPLDLTNSLPLTSDFDSQIKQGSSATAQFIYQLLINNKKSQPPGIWYFWDPLAAVLAVHPELASYSRQAVSVETRVGPEYGATLLDKEKGTMIAVAQTVDKKKFNAFLVASLRD